MTQGSARGVTGIMSPDESFGFDLQAILVQLIVRFQS